MSLPITHPFTSSRQETIKVDIQFLLPSSTGFYAGFSQATYENKRGSVLRTGCDPPIEVSPHH